MNESLIEALPMVTQAIKSSLTNPDVPTPELIAALKGLEKWITWKLPAE